MTKEVAAFANAPKKPITLKHRALVWECMLGTVYAKNADGKVQYFDYDYAAAHEFCGLSECTDLRVARAKQTFADSPIKGRFALYGIRK